MLALACCFLLFIPFSTHLIFLLFLAISISCLNYFRENTIFCIVNTLLFAVITFFFPYAFFFFPLIAYDILSENLIVSFIPYSIIFLLQYHVFTPAQRMVLFVGFSCAILLHRRTNSHESLKEQFKRSRDDSAELQALLKEKNLTLIQKQDAEIYAATLKERNRIAREIHDNVGHLLSRSILMTGALKTTNAQTTLDPNIQVLEETLTSAMDNIRNSVHDLHERSINLPKTLEALIKDCHDYDISFDYDIDSTLPADIKYTCIAIIKEGLNNIIKHSNATKVVLVLREHPSLYQLILHDNGTTTSPINSSSGIGLINMRERIDTLRGNIQITNDSGFRIFIIIPKQEAANEHTHY